MSSIRFSQTGRSVAQRAAFLSACLCGLLGCVLCFLASLVSLCLPASVRERGLRRVVGRLCRGFVAYLLWSGVAVIDFGTLPELARRSGVIVAMNHPTFIDALLALSRLPPAFCIAKESLFCNPLIAPIARGAGYESNVDSTILIRNCVDRLRRGEVLLVFPEGTRTTVPPVGELKRGFVFMADGASVPVVAVTVEAFNGSFLRKGSPLFSFPVSLPLRYRFVVGPDFVRAPDESLNAFRDRIESHFRLSLSSHDLPADSPA
ncbi:1-acyl-sn-glycerol-3-phosphate acyltransferases [Verrucomicrobium sp. GAS474]|uniref:lysophospholipid acyltransferase family protein n=1 Tax=Verrucomicrobium sp. GAS474 TaxID=1882831 RepID=UPI00087A899F|nr:lysophospholipid acyltransferase family protein [Verrucomicrobium sp. GAS474]SDU05188.1 1-acyl-sn-glycerol-3-phosphate acyltransferases [Verrucomicrobium sp. GAS474]